MKIASVADIKTHFSAYLRAAARGPVVVTRSRKRAGVLLAVDDEEEFGTLGFGVFAAVTYDSGRRSGTNSSRGRH